MPWHKTYRYRYEITISNTNIDSDLTDFPVALQINSSAGTGDDDLTKIFDIVGARWQNLCVCASTAVAESPLWTEVDLWDAANESGVLHVRVPKISSSAETTLHLYFDADGLGNGYIGATGSAAGQNVWDDDFVAVHHLSSPATGIQPDSTGNSDATTYNLETDDLVENSTGLKGLDFDGTDEYAQNTDVDAQSLTSDFTVEIYAKPNQFGVTREMLWNKFNSGNTAGWGFTTFGNSADEFYIGFKKTNTDYHTYCSQNYFWSDGNHEHYHAFYYPGDGNAPTQYIDGVDRTSDFIVNNNGGSGAINGLTDSGQGMYWGRGNVLTGTTTYAVAAIYETRMSSGERSAAWIKATYYTLVDGLVSYGSLEYVNPVDATIPWLGNWQNRIALTIPSTNIDEDLTDFPVALSLNSAAGTGTADVTAVFDALGANSHKIAVTDHTGIRQLFVEIETWDETGEEAVLHVKVPHVDADTTTLIYLYYDANKADNDGFVGDTGDAAAQKVWDSYFSAVYHMAQDPSGGAGAIKDSTANGLDGTSEGSMETADLVDGPIGKAIEFNGSDQAIYFANNALLSSGYTVSSWEFIFQTGDAFVDAGTLWNDYGSDEDMVVNFGIWEDAKIRSVWRDAERDMASTEGEGAAVNDSEWHHYVAQRTSQYDVQDYLDSAFVSDASNGSLGNIDTSSGSVPYLAAFKSSAEHKLFFPGKIAEVRITKGIVRSAAWFKATYHTLFDTLCSWGLVETFAGIGWLRGFTYRTQVSIAATNIDASLDYFPVTLFLSSSCGTGTDDMTAIFDEIGANSKKIGVTLADGKTQLPVEIDYWDDTGETAVLHVRVPSISSEETTYLYLYYSADVPDNDEFVGDTGEAPAMSVWDANFVSVHHLSQDPSGTAPQILDSSVNRLHLTTAGTMLTEDLVDGQAGQALDFDGSDDYAYIADADTNDLFDLTDDCMVETVFQVGADWVPSENDYHGVAYKGYALTDLGVKMYERLSGTETQINSVGCSTVVANSFANGAWKYVAGRVNPGTINNQIFVDGAEVGSYSSQTSDSVVPNTYGFYIGNLYNYTADYKRLDGQVDEVRVSSSARSEAWIKATYYSLFDGLIAYNTEIETEDNWLGDWAYRIQVKVDSSLIDEDLTDFPVALHLGGAVGINGADVTAIFDNLGANSLKIAVATADGTQCPVEVDTWDETGETAVLHTMIPTVYADRDTIFYLYYDSAKSDNSTYVGVTGSTPGQAVWDDDFDAVYHFGDASTGNGETCKDSSANSNNGVYTNTEAGDQISGQVGQAISIGGTDEYIVAGECGVQGGGASTLEAIIKYTAPGVGAAIYFGDGDTNGAKRTLRYDTTTEDDSGSIRAEGHGGYVRGSSDYRDDTWRHFVARVGASESIYDIELFVNGAGITETTGGTDYALNTLTTHGINIGRAYSSSTWYYSTIDLSEIRISTVERSDAWIKATYHTLFDTLVAFGAVEAIGSDWSAFLGFGQRYSFTIPATNIDGNLISFPVALALSDSAGTGSDDITPIFDEVGGNYRRVAVGAANGKPIPCEIEIWDDTAESAVLHVKAPLIEADHGAKLYLYFNDNQPDQGWVGDTGDYIAQRVWDENFVGVYHLSDPDSADGETAKDSSQQANDGTYNNTEAGDQQDGGVTGKYVAFGGTNEHIMTGENPITGTGPCTLESVSKCGGSYGSGADVAFGGSAGNGSKRNLRYDGADTYAIRSEVTGGAMQGSADLSDDTWRHLASTYPDAGNCTDINLFINGAEVSGSLVATDYAYDTNASYPLMIGAQYSGAWYYAIVDIDEVRVSDIVRSDAWLKATYYTLFDGLGDWGASELNSPMTTLEETLGKISVEITPHSLSTELSITEWLGKPRVEITPHSLAVSYIGNVVKMVEADGSRPRVASATCQRPGIARASASRPRLSAADEFEYQEREHNG